MKKLIIICLLALTYTSTYAQEPTKQETMDWIASKFKAYGGGLQYYPGYADEEITLTQINGSKIFFSKKSRLNGLSSNFAIELNSVLEIIYEKSNTGEVITLKGPAVCNSLENGKNENFDRFDIYFLGGKMTYKLISFDAEPNLKERMIKAFQTLAKHNNAEKPKEKF